MSNEFEDDRDSSSSIELDSSTDDESELSIDFGTGSETESHEDEDTSVTSVESAETLEIDAVHDTEDENSQEQLTADEETDGANPVVLPVPAPGPSGATSRAVTNAEFENAPLDVAQREGNAHQQAESPPSKSLMSVESQTTPSLQARAPKANKSPDDVKSGTEKTDRITEDPESDSEVLIFSECEEKFHVYFWPMNRQSQLPTSSS